MFRQLGHYFALVVMLSIIIACNKDEEVACCEEDDLLLNTPVYFGDNFSIPADNPMNAEAVNLGRMLFYEKMLSEDTTVSCGSCHKQQFAFSDPGRLSTGVRGRQTSRHSMALINLLYSERFFWDGRSSSLEDQALQPIEDENEMNLSISEAVNRLKGSELYRDHFNRAFGNAEITPGKLAKAIAQFERTLISSNSKYDKFIRGETQLTALEDKGRRLFFTHPEPENNLRGGNCGDCHGSNLLTLDGFHNNGIQQDGMNDTGLEGATGDEADRGKFKTPTLRNIALTAPYMHDGRFNTLEEVLDHYNEHVDLEDPDLDPLMSIAKNESNGNSLGLSEAEKEAIIAFLHTLTDDEFIQNEKFSNPFN